jgi:hypothetical protein
VTREEWFRNPPEILPGDDAETRGFKRRPPPLGMAYDEHWHLVPH